jgi:hypothetical protein
MGLQAGPTQIDAASIHPPQTELDEGPVEVRRLTGRDVAVVLAVQDQHRGIMHHPSAGGQFLR